MNNDHSPIRFEPRTTSGGVEALARALVTAFAEFDGNRPGVILLPPGMTERALAALSPADRLAIAGITEERLAGAITSLAHGRCCWDAPEDARALLAALATPVTPEGGER